MDQREVSGEREKRAQLKAQYRDAFSQLSALLFQHDPISISFKTNTDEYEPEAGTILPRLQSCNSCDDVLNVVCEEFTRWFGEEYGNRDHYREIATAIWKERKLFNLPN